MGASQYMVWYTNATTTRNPATISSLAGSFTTGVIPLGGNAEVILNATQGGELIQAIGDRTRGLNRIRAQKQALVNAATTIAGVIAVDAIGGW
jgi:hypothetical protein